MMTSVNKATDVGKALSREHRQKMVQHAKIVPVMTKEERVKAIGEVNEFSNDVVATYMAKYAEEIFEPKRILDDGDWLVTYREPDQRFEFYKEGRGNIKWLSPTMNKIYLFIADPSSFTDEQLLQYKMYANAFFTGVSSVEILKGGQRITNKKNVEVMVPRDFLSSVTSRES